MSATSTAKTTSTTTSKDPIDWSFADEATLVRGVIARDRRAVAAFITRFKPTIDKKVKFTVSRYSPKLRSTDTVDEIKAEFYEQLFVNNLSRLRAFDASKGTLTAWLSLIAQQTAARHMNRVVQGPKLDPIESFVASEEDGYSEGADWVAHGEDHFVQLLDFKRFVERQPDGANPDRVVTRFIKKGGR